MVEMRVEIIKFPAGNLVAQTYPHRNAAVLGIPAAGHLAGRFGKPVIPPVDKIVFFAEPHHREMLPFGTHTLIAPRRDMGIVGQVFGQPCDLFILRFLKSDYVGTLAGDHGDRRFSADIPDQLARVALVARATDVVRHEFKGCHGAGARKVRKKQGKQYDCFFHGIQFIGAVHTTLRIRTNTAKVYIQTTDDRRPLGPAVIKIANLSLFFRRTIKIRPSVQSDSDRKRSVPRNPHG